MQKLPTCTFRSLSAILRPGSKPHEARTAPGLLLLLLLHHQSPSRAPSPTHRCPLGAAAALPGGSTAPRVMGWGWVGAPREARAAALYLRCPLKWGNPFSSSPGEGAGGNHPAKKRGLPHDRLLPCTFPANLLDGIGVLGTAPKNRAAGKAKLKQPPEGLVLWGWAGSKVWAPQRRRGEHGPMPTRVLEKRLQPKIRENERGNESAGSRGSKQMQRFAQPCLGSAWDVWGQLGAALSRPHSQRGLCFLSPSP